MIDSNGQKLNVGDDIHTALYGMCKIIKINHPYEYGVFIASPLAHKYPDENELVIRDSMNPIKIASWPELAHMAIAMQDACDLVDVVFKFDIVLYQIAKRLEYDFRVGRAPSCSAVAVNTHPIAILLANRIATIAGGNSDTLVTNAFKWCEDKSNREIS